MDNLTAEIEIENQRRDQTIYSARSALIEALEMLRSERAQRSFLDDILYEQGYRSARRIKHRRWDGGRK